METNSRSCTIICLIVISFLSSCKKNSELNKNEPRTILTEKENLLSVSNLSNGEFSKIDKLLKDSKYDEATIYIKSLQSLQNVAKKSTNLANVNTVYSLNDGDEEVPGFYYEEVSIMDSGGGFQYADGTPSDWETDYESAPLYIGSSVVYLELPTFRARLETDRFLPGRNLSIHVVVPYVYSLWFPTIYGSRFKFKSDPSSLPRIEVSGIVGEMTTVDRDLDITNLGNSESIGAANLTLLEKRTAMTDESGTTTFTASASLSAGLQVGDTNSNGIKITRKVISQSYYRYHADYKFYSNNTGYIGSARNYYDQINHYGLQLNSPVVGISNETLIYQGINYPN